MPTQSKIFQNAEERDALFRKKKSYSSYTDWLLVGFAFRQDQYYKTTWIVELLLYTFYFWNFCLSLALSVISFSSQDVLLHYHYVNRAFFNILTWRCLCSLLGQCPHFPILCPLSTWTSSLHFPKAFVNCLFRDFIINDIL